MLRRTFPRPGALSCGATALVGLLAAAGHAQAQTENTFQSWTAAFATVRTNPKEKPASPAVWMDLQARRGSGTTAVLARPGIGYLFDQRFSVWAGYLFAPTFVDGGPTRYENRVWEQFMATFKWESGTLLLRTRAEQRFVVDASDAGHRFRQLVRWQHTLSPRWAAVAWDEIFLAANDTDFGQEAGLDQNRAFLGPAWLPEDGVRLEAGYLFVVQPRSAQTTLIHALSVNCFLAF